MEHRTMGQRYHDPVRSREVDLFKEAGGFRTAGTI